MSHSLKKPFLVFLGLSALICAFFILSPAKPSLPIIAIANYGPHASLMETIQGIKDTLAHKGLIEHQDFVYEIMDANFDHNLIRQMLAKLKAQRPRVLITLSTPVTQAAKTITDIPVVFSVVTSPVEAGLLNMTGASDKQDLVAFLSFAKKILPHSKRMGLLYATSDANDLALVNMMQTAAKQFDMEVVLVPIEQANDVKLRMQVFKNKVDFIYVGVSGPIQPSLPTIAAESARMQIPVFNADSEAVKQHQVLGSYGVSYYQVGINTADIVYDILQGKDPATIAPRYPQREDHQGFVSQIVANKLGIDVPLLENVSLVE